MSGRRKICTQGYVDLVGADRGRLENRKKVEWEVQGIQGLNITCRESMPLLSCVVRGFVIDIIDSPMEAPTRVA